MKKVNVKYIGNVAEDTAYDEIKQKLKEKGQSEEEASEGAGKILSATKEKKKEFQTKGKFQMKNKEFSYSDVYQKVYEIVSKKDSNVIQKRAKEKYEHFKSQINQEQAKMFGGIEKWLKNQNITPEILLEQEYAEEIQNAFQNVINRRVQIHRATGISNISELNEEILEANLNAIRGVRKHEVGMKWQQKTRGY